MCVACGYHTGKKKRLTTETSESRAAKRRPLYALAIAAGSIPFIAAPWLLPMTGPEFVELFYAAFIATGVLVLVCRKTWLDTDLFNYVPFSGVGL